MTAWVGGLTFFAFVVAPIAFGRLSSAHEAGLVVGGCLYILHWIGLIGGALFCLATATLWFRAEVPARVGFALEMILALLMLAVTAYSQFRILPAMERDRVQAGGAIETADISSPARMDFESLHAWSERLEGFVLLCGIGVILVLARESQWPETGKIKQI
jgi:MFS family permease